MRGLLVAQDVLKFVVVYVSKWLIVGLFFHASFRKIDSPTRVYNQHCNKKPLFDNALNVSQVLLILGSLNPQTGGKKYAKVCRMCRN